MSDKLVQDAHITVGFSGTITLSIPAGTSNVEVEKIMSAAYKTLTCELRPEFYDNFPTVNAFVEDEYEGNDARRFVDKTTREERGNELTALIGDNLYR